MTKIYRYKNSILENIYKNSRRINAYFRQNQIRRIKAIVFLLLFLNTSVFAITLENDKYEVGDYTITGEVDPFAYISYNGKQQPNIMYSYNGNPAYCLNRGLKGAEETTSGQIVNVKEKLGDNKLKMIILNGYPYKSVEELELTSIPEAIFATQFAIWCYTDNTIDINKIEPLSYMNETLVRKIKEIYSAKDIPIEESNINVDIKDEKQKTVVEDNRAYYVRKINIANLKNIDSISLECTDTNVNMRKLDDYTYEAKILADLVKNRYDAFIDIEIKANENVVLFGDSNDENYQNMALVIGKYYSPTVEYNISFEEKNTEIIIEKLDIDTKLPIPNVKYYISDNYGYTNKEYLTDKDGIIKINLNNSEDVVIKVKEKEVDSKYVIDLNSYEYVIKPNKDEHIKLYNSKAKGYIEIVKKTKEYNENTNLPENYPLKDVKFNILNENMEIVDVLVTNESGYAKSKELEIGKYYIEEVKTNKYYEKLNELIDVEIKKDKEVTNVQVLNANAFIQKKMPVTGK